jgi:glycosyltransferase involved in cell wall biosynthesis
MISFLVTCKNETWELENLLYILAAHVACNASHEIIVLDDYSDNEETKNILQKYGNHCGVEIYYHHLAGDFAAHKNTGTDYCRGSHVLQIDADEYPSPFLLANLDEIVNANLEVDLFRIPRVNIVRDMTEMDARQWGWKTYSLTEFPGLPIINWENDFQSRLYRKIDRIRWHKKLHETIVGYQSVATLPLEVDYALIHDKTISRQRAQNLFYNKNWSQAANMGNG